MASIRQLADKIKTFEDFSKVVNIQKIVVMKEIIELKKNISQLNFRDILFTNLIIDLHKKHGVYANDMFSDKGNRVPTKRNLYFVLSSNKVMTKDFAYTNKLLVQHIKKNHKEEDIYVVVNKGLAKMLVSEGINVRSSIDANLIDSPSLYTRIAKQVVQGYQDMMYVVSNFIFFDVDTKQITEIPLLPLPKKKRKVEELDNYKASMKNIENRIIREMNISKAVWMRNLEAVSLKVIEVAIKGKAFYVMTKYLLTTKLRELTSLDDKERNIRDEILEIKLKMQRIRQESVTNELLTNAVAFSVLNEEEEEDE